MTATQQLWHLIRFRGRLFASICLLLILNWGTLLGLGLLVRAFFDALGNATNQIPIKIWYIILVFFVLQATSAITKLISVYADVTYRSIIAALLRKNMFQYVLRQPGADALPYSATRAITHFRNDTMEITRILSTLGVIEAIAATVFTIFSLIILLKINPLITIFVLLPLIAVILIVKWMTPRIRLYRQKNLEATEKVTSFIGDILGRIQTIKIASMENHVAQQFDFLNQIRRQAAVNDQVLTQLLNAIFVNVGNLGTGLVLVFASFAIQQGTFSIGDFAFFAFSLTQATRIAEVYGNTITKFQQSKASLHRMDRFMETEPPEKLVEHGSVYDKGEFPPVQYERKSAQSRLDKLEIRDLSYFSTNSPFKLENIHLCLERDTLTVITGRTGSGKSTLLRNIIGLLPMESGQIYWNNQLVEVPDTFFKPPKCAYIPQVPMLFSDSVKNNILLGLEDEDITFTLKQAIWFSVFEKDLKALENNIDTFVGSKGVKLSGGQKQRVATARMLITDSDLLIIDDLSSALDVETEKTIWERITTLPQKTILAVSTRPAALQRADRIIVLKDGEIESTGTFQELLETSEEFTDLVAQWQGQ